LAPKSEEIGAFVHLPLNSSAPSDHNCRYLSLQKPEQQPRKLIFFAPQISHMDERNGNHWNKARRPTQKIW